MWIDAALACGAIVLISLGVLGAMDCRPDPWHPDRKKYPLWR